MTNIEKQTRFAQLISQHILWLIEQGYQVSLGDAYRDPRMYGRYGTKQGYSAANSYHKLRLAIDLNLFRDRVYLMRTEDHKESGKHWESLDAMCTWGGRWNDGNHYSFGEGK